MYATKRDAVDEAILQRRGVDAGVVRDVETALERNELVVVYQPIIDLATGTPHGAEALVRRLLPDRGLLPPADFVPHVERTPVVRELTFLVVADALRSAQLWRDAGHDLRVSVNIPYRLVDDAVFADGLERMLHDANVEPGALTLEVVPAGPGAGSELDDDVLVRLSQLGVRLSLDDGGRAASFAALRVLPLDELKIDAGFVHGLGRSATDAALVHGMIDIGHALGLTVVAEGVETTAGLARARRVGMRLRAGLLRREPAQRRRARHLARRRLARSRLDDEPARRTRARPRRAPHRARAEACARARGPSCARRATRPGSPRRGPREDGPVDAGAGGMRREAGDPEKEADDEVRPRGPADVHADRPDERRHAKRPQDDADRAPEHADEEREAASPPDTHPLTRAGCDRPEREIDTAPDEDAGDQPVQQGLGDVVGEQRPAIAPTTDGGAVHATIRQSTRPSRACFSPPAPAAAAETAMFVPAAVRGLPVARTISGSRSVPSTRPSIEPRYPGDERPRCS